MTSDEKTKREFLHEIHTPNNRENDIKNDDELIKKEKDNQFIDEINTPE